MVEVGGRTIEAEGSTLNEAKLNLRDEVLAEGERAQDAVSAAQRRYASFQDLLDALSR